MKIQVRKGNCLDYNGEMIVLFHYSDIKPLKGNPALLDWRCNASVSVLWKRKMDLFQFGQLTILATQGKIPAEAVILTGLGTNDALDRDMRKEACRLALVAALKFGARDVAVDGVCLVSDKDHDAAEEIRRILAEIDRQSILRITLYTGDNRQQSAPGREE